MQLGKYHEFDPLTFEESIPSKILSWVIMIRYLYRMNVLKWRKIPISKHCLLRNVFPNHGTLNFTGRSYVKCNHAHYYENDNTIMACNEHK